MLAANKNLKVKPIKTQNFLIKWIAPLRKCQSYHKTNIPPYHSIKFLENFYELDICTILNIPYTTSDSKTIFSAATKILIQF